MRKIIDKITVFCYNKPAAPAYPVDTLAEARKAAILGAKDKITITGTAYYVSEHGGDNNDGEAYTVRKIPSFVDGKHQPLPPKSHETRYLL